MVENTQDPSEGQSGRNPNVDSGQMVDWVEVCADLLGADGAAVVVASAQNPDARRVLYATDGVAAWAADLLYVLGCGPHAEAMADDAAHSLVVDDPADAGRWPLLVNELTALGVGWVRAIPLGRGGHPIGTLQLVRTHSPSVCIPGYAEALVDRLARLIGTDIAVGAIVGNQKDGDADLTHMAIGMVMARYAITAEAASAMLRADAYATGRLASEQARLVVARSANP